MNKFDFNLFVIGAGSGGVRAARIASSFGAKVAIAEERYLGGTCVNVGCVPKKLLVYASRFSEEFKSCVGFGWDFDNSRFSWKQLIANKNNEIKRLNQIYERLLNDAGVELIHGKAEMEDANTLRVNNQTYSAERIFIATGGWPTKPDIPGNEYAITSNEAFNLESLPERIVIAGGGYVAIEFAGIFNGLGVETIIIYRGPLILRGFDEELRKFVSNEIEKKGIKLILNTTIESIKNANNICNVHLSDGDVIETDKVMFATGRKPNTSDLGLENIGIKLDNQGAIIINQDYQTSSPSVYAIGDVTNRYNLTPVALAEGMALAKTLYAHDLSPVSYNNIPTCVFCQPNLASVGLTEEDARKQINNISVYKSEFKHLKHTMTDIDEMTFMKLIVDSQTDKVIGAHMVGEDAGEIIQGISIAMNAGVTKSQFDTTIGIHPTAAEEFVTMRTPSV